MTKLPKRSLLIPPTDAYSQLCVFYQDTLAVSLIQMMRRY